MAFCPLRTPKIDVLSRKRQKLTLKMAKTWGFIKNAKILALKMASALIVWNNFISLNDAIKLKYHLKRVIMTQSSRFWNIHFHIHPFGLLGVFFNSKSSSKWSYGKFGWKTITSMLLPESYHIIWTIKKIDLVLWQRNTNKQKNRFLPFFTVFYPVFYWFFTFGQKNRYF